MQIMEIPLDVILDIVLGFLAFSVGFIYKHVGKKFDAQEKKINDLTKQVNDFQVEVSSEYIVRSEFSRTVDNIDRKLDKLFELLSHKEDRK